MDKLSTLTIQILLILLFSSLQFLYSDYTPPKEYFINCGSSDDFTDSSGRRTFVEDVTHKSFSLSAKHTSALKSTNSSDPDPSQTARIFLSQSSYEFPINQTGTYFLRFHFFPFTSQSQTDLRKAIFDVSAFGSTLILLQNYTLQNTSTTVVEEFLFTIDPGKFRITFTPQESSFAFVNAVEVFLSPDDFIQSSTVERVSPAGQNGNYSNLTSQVLHTVHRINVGGPTIARTSDTLWRLWLPDDAYLGDPSTAENSNQYTDRPKYEQSRGVTDSIAPDSVYQTSKEINVNYSSNSSSRLVNITWGFNVSKDAKHLLRLHFCDVISDSLDTIVFNLFLFAKYNYTVDPFNVLNLNWATPFYHDYVVDSDTSGIINVSIGNRPDSDNRTAYLNGLEIMQIMGPTPSLSPSPPNKDSKKTILIIVVSIVSGLALICCLAITIFSVLKKKKGKKPIDTTSVWSAVAAPKEGSSHAASSLNLSLKISLSELQSATRNFNKKLIVGKGGFGNVYRAKLSDGRKVAVKRSQLGSGQGLIEFHTEINVLSKIRHRHLVSLIGYCDEGPEMILVYEFMEKGTLRDHLYNSKFLCLSWKQRLEICIGAAKGLQYLHRGSAAGIIHRDVKSTNILLDENYEAKVADFGLSKLASFEETHVSTGVKGTFGYLDPDYFRSHQLTEKSDVYSFGVVLLEVLCARPALDRSRPREQVNLADWGLLCRNNGTLDRIVDPLIRGEIEASSLRKFGEVAEKCLQEYGSDRPTMSDVLWDLEYALKLQENVRRVVAIEDSATDCSAAFAAMPMESFPSMSLSFAGGGGNDTAVTMEDGGSDMTASEVFSQLKMDDAR